MLLEGSCHCGAVAFRAEYDGGERGSLQRHFRGARGSMLWAWSPHWPEPVHPFASAIDTALPTPPERTHLMPGSKAARVEPRVAGGDKSFDEYPDESIAGWHERLGLVGE